MLLGNRSDSRNDDSMKPRFLPCLRALLGMLALVSCAAAQESKQVHQAEVVIVGGTPAGVMAGVAAARSGRTVLIIERTAHLGGLPANGLGATDIKTRGATGGLFTEFVGRVRRYYVEHYGEDSAQVKDCDDGYHFEPSVASKVIYALIAEYPGIKVLHERQFDSYPENVRLADRAIVSIRILNRRNQSIEHVDGRVFIDATYEGDLAAAAGAPYRLGREDAREHNEPMAGQLYKGWGGEVAEGSSGRGDNAVQAYNYRLPLTKMPEKRVPIERPEKYDRDEYASLVEDLRLNRHTGRADVVRREIDWDGIGRVVNIVTLPNGKSDANNQHASFLSTDLPEENWPWPTSSWEWRDRFAKRLRDYTLGLLWFCQNDPALPADFRARCAEWGLARDEFEDNGHFPRQLYVREGRRIMGDYLFTAHDALPHGSGSRPPIHQTSMTASHYALDSHAVRKRETGRAHLDGFFSKGSRPYTVPYGVITPREVEALLVPVAASATHVGLSTLRMEPCWMALGEAAGTAASVAIENGTTVRNVAIEQVQGDLLRHGAVLIYFSDVQPGHPQYEALQMLGLRGLFPNYEADLAKAMTLSDIQGWRSKLGLPAESSPSVSKLTRGQYVEQLWRELSEGRTRVRK